MIDNYKSRAGVELADILLFEEKNQSSINLLFSD
jgi:hypothetical protein